MAAIHKLIIIGNGFDLAHGYDTTFEDFLYWHFTNNVLKTGNSKLVSIDHDGLEMVASKSYDNFKELWKIITNLHGERNLLKYTHSHALLKHVLNKKGRFWVDFEHAYFDLLKGFLPTNNKVYPNKLDWINQLNGELRYTTNELHRYIASMDQPEQALPKFTEIFKPKKYSNSSTVILNFNYTRTLDTYMIELERENVSKIDIHGSAHGSKILGDGKIDPEADNPIVFGYGDELDESFQEMEDQLIDEYFEHIKKYKYFLSPNYRELLTFIEGSEYDVHIIGHSCGLTDRTLLNSIFENDHCKNIVIHHYRKRQAFINDTYSISRIFKNKQKMLDKIVSYDPNNECPQTKEAVLKGR